MKDGKEIHIDRRILRTKKSIRTAFTELVKEKEPSRITVKELSNAAGINRKTFYMYYAGIDELLVSIEDDALAKFKVLFEQINLKDNSFDALDFFQRFSDIIHEDIETFRMLDNIGFTPHLIEGAKAMIIDMAMKYLKFNDQGEMDKFNLYAEFTVTGLLAMFSKWLQMPNVSINEFIDMARKIIVGGLGAFGLTDKKS